MKSTELLANFIWKFAERFGTQIVSFVVSIILARILDPDVYGKVAIITVFTTILSVFCDSGLGNSLIQKKDSDDIDFSTVFYTNVTISVALYLLMYIAAPYIASYYNDKTMVPLIRVLSLTLPFSGVKNIQQAYVSKNMIFKKFFFSSISGIVCSAVVGISVAVKGGGAWALVLSNLTLMSVDTCVLWFTVPWRPKAVFSWRRLKTLFSYGWRLLASGLMESIYSNMRSLIIGKRYSQASLAFYSKGKTFPDLIVSNVNISIDSVLFPALSKEQDNRESVKNMTRRAITTSIYVIAPFLLGLAAVAEPMVLFLIGKKWIESVPYVRIFCVYLLFWPIHTANLNAIKALGRSDVILKQEIAKKITGILILIATIPYGVFIMACGLLIEGFICQLINSWPNRKLIDYSYPEQLRDVAKTILLAAFMAICVYPISLLGLSAFFTIILQVILGIVIYISGSYLLKIETFKFMLSILTRMFQRMIKSKPHRIRKEM